MEFREIEIVSDAQLDKNVLVVMKLLEGILKALHTGPDKDSLSPCPKTTAALAKDRPGMGIEEYLYSHSDARDHAAVTAIGQRGGVLKGGAKASTQ